MIRAKAASGLGEGGMDGRTDGWTDGKPDGWMDAHLEIHPCALQDIGPLGPLPKKANQAYGQAK